jgi:hypothetical protein
MDNFVPHIDRLAILYKSFFYDLNGTINTRTKATGVG